MESHYVDVLVVGAGVSGIGAGWHLQNRCPKTTYAILEARESLGGTWDLFRFPGIRSDSDMYTFAYSFKPWTGARCFGDGQAILAYLKETAEEHGIDGHIRYRHRARKACWSTETALWTIDVDVGPNSESTQYTCRFLYLCAGYFNYAAGHTPDFPGREQFSGRIVHPQQWTDDIDCTDKRVVVIGSGATAVTLIPVIARKARHVTMLQRSPTYIFSWPGRDRFAGLIARLLPAKAAFHVSRGKYLLLMPLFYQMARRFPAVMKRIMIGGVRRQLDPGFDVATHFTPRYNPWEQRVCMAPNGDFFRAIKAGDVSVVTDRIRSFSANGIVLESDRELEADVIVTATGLELKAAGGLDIFIDGKRTEIASSLQYKGALLSGIPNLASCFGYINASWTLKADLVSEYVCRLVNHMDATGMRQCIPELNDPSITPGPFLDFSSGYITRSIGNFAKQGCRRPWKVYQNYALDVATLRFGKLDDGTLVFSNPAPTSRPPL